MKRMGSILFPLALVFFLIGCEDAALQKEIKNSVPDPDATPVAVEAVSLNQGTVSLTLGQQISLTASISPPNATDKTVSWETDNGQIASVLNGLVTATGIGTATITVRTADGDKSATCTVTVSDTPIANVSLDLSSLSLSNATLTPAFSADVTTYSAVVDTPISTTRVYAFAKDSANCTVTVNPSITPQLDFGNNQIIVSVRQNGVDRSQAYIVNIYRSFYMLTYSGLESDSGVPPVDSNKYKLNDSARVATISPDLIKNGSSFYHWSTEPGGAGTVYHPGEVLYLEGDTTLYPVWGPKITSIVGGNGSRIYVLNESGNLYACGDNANGYFGDGTSSVINRPRRLVQTSVKAAYNSTWSTYILKTDNDLYASGLVYSNFGSTHQSLSGQKALTPLLVENNVDEVFIQEKTTLFRRGGDYYTVGEYSGYLTGENSMVNEWNLKQITTPAVGKVMQGQGYSAWIVDSSRNVWGTSSGNTFGEAGTGTTSANRLAFAQYHSGIKKAIPGWEALYLIDTDDNLYASGRNLYGRLGVASDASSVTTKTFTLGPVETVAPGKLHTLFLTTDGKVYAAGNNQYGQLGIGTTENHNAPVFVMDNVSQIQTTSYASIVLKKDGTVWWWGNIQTFGSWPTDKCLDPVRWM